jgi:hypothetical protein
VSDTPTASSDLLAQRVEDWRRRLIDLTHRNRLIAYKPTQATTLNVVNPGIHELLADPDRGEPWDFYFPPASDEPDEQASSDAATTVDALVVQSQDRGRPRRANEIEVSEPNPKRIARILHNLARRSHTEFQDKALRILYLAAGFLDWREPQQEKWISSPLVLVPVELRRESTRDAYRLFLLDQEEIMINPSLTEKLRRDAGLEVPGDWAWEDKPLAQELDEIRQAVAGNGWTVREDGALGLFSFQKYVMYRDLVDNEELVSRHPVIRSLAYGRLLGELQHADAEVPALEELDRVQQPARTLSILDADASQRQCVEVVKQGGSFVMQGPPGTGKSQTIANVIAEAIGRGERVLFVSEKAAALDVVFKRLTASGLDDYCLMLHGEHAGRREVVQALDRTLTSSLQARVGMHPHEVERLGNLRSLLNDSAELLHLPQPLLGGRTLREVHEQLAELHAAPSIAGAPEPQASTDGAVLGESESLNEVFQRLADRWRVSSREYLWRGYDADRFTADDRARVLAMLRSLMEATDATASPAGRIAAEMGVPAPRSLGEAQRLVGLGDHLRQAPAIEAHWLDLEPTALSEAAEAGEAAYAALDAGLAEFDRLWPARTPDDFPIGVAGAVDRACDEVRRRCGWTAAWTDQLPALRDALRVLDDLPARMATVRDRAAATAAHLGQPTDKLTVDRLDRLAELAELSFSAERRPERDWLVRAGFERAERLHAELAEDLSSFQRQRSTILEQYTEAALDLDAAVLARRFRSTYVSRFAKLSGAYRQDAKAIRTTRRDGKLPAAIVDDLTSIASVQEIGARIDASSERASQAFGAYAAGRDTDGGAVAGALATARRVIDLGAADSDLELLGDMVAIGSAGDPRVARAADQQRAALGALERDLATLQRFVAEPGQLFAQDLDHLEDTLGRIVPPLRALGALTADLDSGTATAASSIEQVRERARLIDEVHATQERVADRRSAWSAVIGEPFVERESDWGRLRGAAAWLVGLQRFGSDLLTEPMRERLRSSQRDWSAFASLSEGCDRMRAAAAAVTGSFDAERGVELDRGWRSSSFPEVVQLCARWAERVDELGDWTEWRAWCHQAKHHGWSAFVDALVDARVGDDGVLPAFERAYWNRRLEVLYREEPELAEDLRGGAFQRWVDEFRELDRKLVRTGADRLIRRREDMRTSHVAAPGSEADLLRREARKKRRHLPVRTLLSRIPTLLSELKPCLMMSPLTVSHFLAPEHAFDLVVFDEASQVPPQDAVNCIYRGRQLVVAGDSRQLPPTPFFQIAELDKLAPEYEDASTQEDMESILEACAALLPVYTLRWHYRSRSESLIAFSNRHIYDGVLVTFPSAQHRSRRLGVGFVHVPEGVYDRGGTACNRPEAKEVARRLMHFLLDGTGRSVGVIAFNTAQANAISEELDLLKVQHPELEQHFRSDRLNGVFVKHLEAVQGDERDVIIFSIGYGRDAKGAFTMNFGPLNRDGGQRRLNVAITRARERVELVSSVRARDFQLSDTASTGARMLRDYIAYAEAEGRFDRPEGASADAAEWPSPLERQVANTIAELGYEACPSVGVGTFRIDVGVRAPGNPDRFIMGIECDGEGYARTPTARDRERLRHEVLDALGWGPIHRIWSLDWVRNRADEVERLRRALAAASTSRQVGTEAAPADGSSTAAEAEQPRQRVERVVHELNDAAAAGALPWTTPYRRARLGSRSSYYEFHESANRSTQTKLLIELLAVEAPICVDYAIRRLAEAWGLRRAGHRVVAAGREAVSQAESQGAVELRGEFLWRPGQPLPAVRVPDPNAPDTRRDIDEIPPEEIDLAIAHMREASAGLDDRQLVAQVARIFGFDRTGERIGAVLSERILASRRAT